MSDRLVARPMSEEPQSVILHQHSLTHKLNSRGNVTPMRMTRHGASLSVHTPAKLNLTLKILGRRHDGFHDLESLMVSVRLYDSLSFAPATDEHIVFSVSSAHSSVPADQSNLVVRAAKLLKEYAGSDRGALITLSKQIPSQAGMGGGSSDAAATLIGLNELWNLRISSRQLHHLAAQLGSDVNFFLDSQPAALCTGRGETVHPVMLRRRLDFVVVKPETGLSTADVFHEWKQAEPRSHIPAQSLALERSLTQGPQQQICDYVSNSLEPAAIHLNSEIRDALTRLRNQRVIATSMTGSGSACFGICRSSREAHRLAKRLSASKIGHVWAISTGV